MKGNLFKNENNISFSQECYFSNFMKRESLKLKMKGKTKKRKPDHINKKLNFNFSKEEEYVFAKMEGKYNQ